MHPNRQRGTAPLENRRIGKMKTNTFEKWLGIAATVAAIETAPLMAQDLGMTGGEDPKGKTASTESESNAPTLYENPKMSQYSLLRQGGFLEFMNDDNLQFTLHKSFATDNAGLRKEYSEQSHNLLARDNVAFSLKGNKIVQLGENELSLSGKYQSLMDNDQQYQKNYELFTKLTLKGSKTQIIGLRLLGNDSSLVNGVGGFYGMSTQRYNAGFGIDAKPKTGIDRVFAGADYLALPNLMLSGKMEKKFASENQLSSESITFGVTYAFRKVAIGGTVGLEHITQKTPESYIWAPNADINGNNFHVTLSATYLASRNITLKPFVTWDNLKAQPYGGRFNNVGFGLQLELNFGEMKKLFGSGGGFSSAEQMGRQESRSSPGFSSRDEHKGVYLQDERLGASLDGVTKRDYARSTDSGLYLPEKKDMDAKQKMLQEIRNAVKQKNLEHAVGTYSQKQGSKLFTLNK